jgi:4a-hydroxytetrahydrobiopterin dehydratase
MKTHTFIAANPDWFEENDKLVAGFEFTDFATVKKVVQGILHLADVQNHHPEVTFSYNTVEIKTVTHDAGSSITEKDFALAKAISKLVAGES